MKTLLKSAVLLLGMGLLSTHSQAQKVVVEDKEPNSVMFVTIDKAGNEIIRIMNASQSPRFHEPKAPRFLLTDRKGKFALGIGGYVKLAAEYDFGGISDNIDFYPALIPGRGQSYVRNQFQMDATTSTISWTWAMCLPRSTLPVLTGCRSIMPHRSVTNMRSPKV